eukprot:4794971-Pyramimonas_sp.AAC.1
MGQRARERDDGVNISAFLSAAAHSWRHGIFNHTHQRRHIRWDTAAVSCVPCPPEEEMESSNTV